jgi:tetratricopeptide (TPR) repeat protein
LVSVATDQHIWARSYDRDVKDVLTLQSEVARDIALQIQSRMTPQQQVRVAKVSRCSPEAHDLVLQGMYHWFKATPDDLEKTRTYGERAVALDPDCARSHEVLAYYYSSAADEGLLPPKEAWEAARNASVKALALDDTLSGPHIALGAISLLLDWNWNVAEKEFKRGIELNPSFSEGHREYSLYLRTMGRTEEAIVEIRQAQDLDPLSVSMSASVGWALYYARRWDDAIGQFQKTLRMDPTFLPAHEGLAKCYEQLGMEREAIDALISEMKLGGATDLAESFRRIYEKSGYRAAIRKLYEVKLAQFRQASSLEYVSPFIFADLYALAGDREHAFIWLEKAYEERSSKLLDLKIDPDFDLMRSDSRFDNLLRRVGLP